MNQLEARTIAELQNGGMKTVFATVGITLVFSIL